MKDRFVVTKSIRKYFDGINHICHKKKGVERMLLIIGEPGLGKTEGSLNFCAVNDGVYIRTFELMTGPWLLRTIVSELGAAPSHRSDKNIKLIDELLIDKPRVIIFDEVDRFTRKPDILETLRDIHDFCHTPLVFVGEEASDKELMRNRRLYRRFVEIIRFEKLDLEGVRHFLSEISDIKYQDDAVEKIKTHTNGKISEIMTMIHYTEKIARTNQIKIVGAADLK